MIKEALKYLKDSWDENEFSIGEITYLKKDYIPAYPLRPSTIEITNLSGIVDFVSAFKEKDNFFIIIENHSTVYLSGDYDKKYQTRPIYVNSAHKYKDFMFGNPFDIESFIVYLQSRFAESKNKSDLISKLSNIIHEAAVTYEDDGTTLNITKKTGIQRRENAKIENPLDLIPLRIFPELDQIESQFIFRMKSENTPSCSLFEVDGGEWKIKTVQMIKNYFNKKLPDIPMVG